MGERRCVHLRLCCMEGCHRRSEESVVVLRVLKCSQYFQLCGRAWLPKNLLTMLPIYMSKCGTLPPESCFFSLICSTGSFMVILIGLLRYAHVIEKHQNCVLNTAGLSTCWICAAGLIMVGNFQVDYAKVLHYVGAGVAFPTSILFVCLQSALTYRLAKTQREYIVGHLRMGMSLLAFITLVFSGVFFVQESFALQHASAIFEWLFCIIIMLFFGTFAFEFGDMSGDTLMVLARGGVQGFSSSDHKAEEAGGPNHHYQPDGIAML
ncbi:transmembrane protein 150A-like isoform X2 [Salvelinus fontinalis]|uniref:transmembrane protein 150A-like isoform X2 n=1 Tax=Salvelinus fontinalis TaxID=8038 RepID=UPI002486422D|nr:transmembrane protein 150A-like isoform X2 [Salvelinus fontinalis]